MADEKNQPPALVVNFRLAMDFGDKRAGGINRQEIAFRGCFRNRFGNAMGRENDGRRSIGDFIEFLTFSEISTGKGYLRVSSELHSGSKRDRVHESDEQ
jgi:hypothetical protein